MDKIEVQVELIDAKILDRYRELEKIEQDLQHSLRNVLQIDAKVKLVSPKTLERSTGKAKRVIDLRNE
jgi:phenylacetate-CoA ligase